MQIIEQSASLENFQFENEMEVLRAIERAARTCYKSEAVDSEAKTKAFLKKLYDREHLSVFEHIVLTGRFITNRGTTHELVRHRIAAYSQESTRFCNYTGDEFGNEITVILPVFFLDTYRGKNTPYHGAFRTWSDAMWEAEGNYFELITKRIKPQIARGVLPIDLKTEIVATMNLRQWWWVFELRRNPAAHPQMYDLMEKWWNVLSDKMPFLFGEIQGAGAEITKGSFLTQSTQRARR